MKQINPKLQSKSKRHCNKNLFYIQQQTRKGCHSLANLQPCRPGPAVEIETIKTHKIISMLQRPNCVTTLI